ncbi:hypothetical protein Tsubulata_026676 [Turnera subulata]|uniref:Uncharacterized protein n=1 Tax=Turnera subulata TaxID=218843 RepID=A0A9Q0JBK4_9ROSI|nr:hypothetical protein Tsubulata_026676 [Turnera subulata]
MMTSAYSNIKLPYLQNAILNIHAEVYSCSVKPTKPRRRKPRKVSSFSVFTAPQFGLFDGSNAISKPSSYLVGTVLTKASGDDNEAVSATPQQLSSNSEESNHGSSSIGESYVPLFVRMLGLDNDPSDREQAIVTLWQYSQEGRKCIDNIMQFQGCINLIVNLLQSESTSASEAAAGLLRSISSINSYRDVVAESGAIEEITALLRQPSLATQVKEQSICTLWNLSADQKLGQKIANSYILPLLVKSLDDEEMNVKEAAGGVLSNLALTHSNHSIMVEAGVIPKLAAFLTAGFKPEAKVIWKEALNTLVELAKNEYYRILIIEEGLIPVPLIGAAAYKSFTPNLKSWPTFPDGTEIERSDYYDAPSKYGANKVLLGLSMKNKNIDEAKEKAIIGRARQARLARFGLIEPKLSQAELSNDQFILLPWVDGAARLVLILGLEDELAIKRAAEAIANAAINEHMRKSFKEAGAIKNLVPLLGHRNDAIKFAVIGALEKLSISYSNCQIIESQGVMSPLINILKNSETPENMMEKTSHIGAMQALNLLARILDPDKEMRSKFYDGPVNGFKDKLDAARTPDSSNGSSTGSQTSLSEANTTRQEVLDSDVASRLVEMLKHSSPSLQTKAASILEYMAIIDSDMDTIMSVNIESGLDAVFQQKILSGSESDDENQQPEIYALQIEAGMATSAASRLLTKLLDSDKFRSNINSAHFTELLRKILKSNIPLQYKDWVAAALVKLGYVYGETRPNLELESPIPTEVTLYETIPRLIEQLRSSFSPEAQEAAVVELNRIISKGVLDAAREVASAEGLVPLVKIIEGGNERAVEAALSILYNLSMDNENHSVILASGVVPALRRIVISERPQWKRALHLLRTLPS